MEETDRGFVMQTWLKNYRETTKAKRIPSRVYFSHYHDLIEKLLERDDTSVSVASDYDDPGRIFGWLATSNLYAPKVSVVHYVYVKSLYRGHGLARRLMTEAGVSRDGLVVYTFVNPRGRNLARKAIGAEFMPVEDFVKESA